MFNVVLPWVQLSPPDNATSSSVYITAQLLVLRGICLGEHEINLKVF